MELDNKQTCFYYLLLASELIEAFGMVYKDFKSPNLASEKICVKYYKDRTISTTT